MKVFARELVWLAIAATLAFSVTLALCGWQWPDEGVLVSVGPYSTIEARSTALFVFGVTVLTRAAVLAIVQDRRRRRDGAHAEPAGPLRFAVLGCLVTLAALLAQFVSLLVGGDPAAMKWMLPLWPLFEPWLFGDGDPSSGAGLILLIAVVMLQWPLLGAVVDSVRWLRRRPRDASGAGVA
ncbi:MAG: hypothetical protein H6835_15900 [Planctomycetes bacterium]|nr:hypothetical protein [Planctomycetota bacterium]